MCWKGSCSLSKPHAAAALPGKEVDAVLSCVALVSTFPFHKHFPTALKDLKLSKEKGRGMDKQPTDAKTVKVQRYIFI